MLGPLLFILFINDLPLHIDFCELDLYADDATMTASSSSLSTLLNFMRSDLHNFLIWCVDNDTTLNLAKKIVMFLSSKQNINRILSDPPNIVLNGEPIRISQQKTGINTDISLSWHSQIDNALNKCNTLLFLFGRIKQYLSIPIRKLFYNAYILPHLDYCCTIWGNTTADSINAGVKFQKRVARLILDRDFDAPSAEHFAELDWMIFPERVKFQKAIMMFKSMNN